MERVQLLLGDREESMVLPRPENHPAVMVSQRRPRLGRLGRQDFPVVDEEEDHQFVK